MVTPGGVARTLPLTGRRMRRSVVSELRTRLVGPAGRWVEGISRAGFETAINI